MYNPEDMIYYMLPMLTDNKLITTIMTILLVHLIRNYSTIFVGMPMSTKIIYNKTVRYKSAHHKSTILYYQKKYNHESKQIFICNTDMLYNNYFIKYKGQYIYLHIYETEDNDGDRTIIINNFKYFAKDARYIKTFIDDMTKEQIEDNVRIKTEWMSVKFNSKKTFSSIFSNHNDYIINVLDKFNDKDNYKSNYGEQPYKEAFLLYGPPGTGKTSIIKALINYTKMSVYSYSNFGHHAPSENTIIICEEIDILMEQYVISRENASNDKINRELILKEIHNDFMQYLDGLIELHNVIIIFTTNNPEKLPKELIRPGRIDHKLYLGPMNNELINGLLNYHNIDPIYGLDEEVILPCELENIIKYRSGHEHESIRKLYDKKIKNGTTYTDPFE